MREYLREFLSDPRVVKLPRWLWLPILHGIVLRTRPARSRPRTSGSSSSTAAASTSTVIAYDAILTVDNKGGWRDGDWNKQVKHEDFMHHFDKWNYDWIDIPALIRGASDSPLQVEAGKSTVMVTVSGSVQLR